MASSQHAPQRERVEIGGQYWSAQLRTFDALADPGNDLVVFRTGYGGGKTLLGSDWILGIGLEIAGGHSLVLAPDKTKGGPATYKGFYERLPGRTPFPTMATVTPRTPPSWPATTEPNTDSPW